MNASLDTEGLSVVSEGDGLVATGGGAAVLCSK